MPMPYTQATMREYFETEITKLRKKLREARGEAKMFQQMWHDENISNQAYRQAIRDQTPKVK